MKVVITGAAGFIGAHLASRISSYGAEVICIDRLSNYYSPKFKLERFKCLNPKLQLKFWDISNISNDFIKLKNIDAIVHLAAQPGIRVNSKNFHNYLNDNLSAFNSILVMSRQLDVDKLIYASSSSVYEKSEIFPYSESEELEAPNGLYAYTKWLSEQLAERSSQYTNTQILGLRFFTVYGPWGRPDMAFFRLVDAAMRGKVFTVNGSLEVARDFTYIDDVVEILSKLIFMNRLAPPILNIGKGKPIKLSQWVNLIESESGNKIRLNYAEQNKLDKPLTIANPELLNKTLIENILWTSHAVGLRKSLEWYRNQEKSIFDL